MWELPQCRLRSPLGHRALLCAAPSAARFSPRRLRRDPRRCVVLQIALDVDLGLCVVRELRRIAVPDAKGVSFTLALPVIKTAEDIDNALGTTRWAGSSRRGASRWRR